MVVLAVFGKPHGLTGLAAVGLGFVVLLVVYDTVLTAVRGGSIGKRLVRVVVTRVDGTKPSLWRLVVRPLVLFGPAFLPGIGQLYLLFCVVSAVRDEDRKRGWHDRVAGTVVLTEP